MTEALLIASAASALFMCGLSWFVGVVHYPLFSSVGRDQFLSYHERHSSLTTWVVLPPMSVELASSLALPFFLDGETALAALGAGLAVSTWIVTAMLAVPHHRGMARGFAHEPHAALLRAHHVRTVLWTAHSVVGVALIAQAIPAL